MRKILLLSACLLVTGCQAHKDNETVEEKKATHEQNMENAKFVFDQLKASKAPFFMKFSSGGKPSVGMSTDFYLNTDMGFEAMVFGNFGSDGPTVEKNP